MSQLPFSLPASATANSKLLLVLLLLVHFTRHASSISVKYVYEGPTGCNSDECYCTTETVEGTAVQTDGTAEASSDFVKITRCENFTGSLGAYLMMHVPTAVFSTIREVKQFSAEMWIKLAEYCAQIGTIMVNFNEKYVSGYVNTIAEVMTDAKQEHASEYLNRINKNINKACQFTTDTVSRCWEKVNNNVAYYSGKVQDILSSDSTQNKYRE